MVVVFTVGLMMDGRCSFDIEAFWCRWLGKGRGSWGG